MKTCKKCNRLLLSSGKCYNCSKNTNVEDHIKMYGDTELDIRNAIEKEYGNVPLKMKLYTKKEMIDKYIRELTFWIKQRKPMTLEDFHNVKDKNIQQDFMREYMLAIQETDVRKRIREKFNEEEQRQIYDTVNKLINI